MNLFPVILKELMEEKSIDVKCLAHHFGLSDPSIIYRWLKGNLSLLLPAAVKIADFFNCSLDYLFGRSDDNKDNSYKECPPFNVQFRKILNEQKISQNKLLKNKVVSCGNLNCWLNKKQTPQYRKYN